MLDLNELYEEDFNRIATQLVRATKDRRIKLLRELYDKAFEEGKVAGAEQTQQRLAELEFLEHENFTIED